MPWTAATASAWGIYRSDDAGATWQHLDDLAAPVRLHQLLAGDPRQPGRVYLGTGGRGIVYGDPQLQRSDRAHNERTDEHGQETSWLIVAW